MEELPDPPNPQQPLDKDAQKQLKPWLFKPGDPRFQNRSFGIPIVNGKKIREMCRAMSPEIIAQMKVIFDDERQKTRDRLVAGSIILDRAFGKPAQEFRINDGAPMMKNLTNLDSKDLDDLENIVIKIQEPIVTEATEPQSPDYIPPDEEIPDEH